MSPFANQQVADAGDIGVNPFNINEAIETIDTEVTALRKDGSAVLTLGGDHTIALPILRSLHRDHGPIAVLHFGRPPRHLGHLLRPPYTHGTPFRRASEGASSTWSGRCTWVSVGRCTAEGPRGRRDPGLPGDPLRRLPGRRPREGVRERMVKRLAGGPVYVSVDIDVLDPAHAPGTGTPEAGDRANCCIRCVR